MSPDLSNGLLWVLTYGLLWVLSVVALYWIVRLAVRHAIQDADGRRQTQAPRSAAP
jgi:hypothetical protein